MQFLTESRSLFDIISKWIRTSEKRLMHDIACAGEGYRKFEIDDIGIVRSGDNMADCLTKRMKRSSLLKVLTTSILEVRPGQWIVRDNHPRHPRQ